MGRVLNSARTLYIEYSPLVIVSRSGISKHNRETTAQKRNRLIHEACVRVCSNPKSAPAQYMKKLLEDLVSNGTLPIESLASIPKLPSDVQKTRFDQIYDAVMYLAHPAYPEDVRKAILGPEDPDPEIRMWRVILPVEFGIYSLILRASNYPLAFARACDYVSRRFVREYRKAPQSLHFQVKYIPESELRRHYKIRRVNRRRQAKIRESETEFSTTDRQLFGVRTAALGSPRNPDYSVIRYIEKRDQEKIASKKGNRLVQRHSSVELETYRDSDYVLDDTRRADLRVEPTEK